jgi:hypothetical protein
MSKKRPIELPTGQLTIKQMLERRKLRLERLEHEAMRREAAREREEMVMRRVARAREAAIESRERGSMTLPRMVRGV